MAIFFIQQVSAQAMLNVVEMFKKGLVSAEIAMQILGGAGPGAKNASVETPRSTKPEVEDPKRKHGDGDSKQSPTKDSETASPPKKDAKTQLESWSWTHIYILEIVFKIQPQK